MLGKHFNNGTVYIGFIKLQYIYSNISKDSEFDKELKVPRLIAIFGFGHLFNNGNADVLDLSHTYINDIKKLKL